MTETQTRSVWPPEPGFFTLRLVRGGWRVPARIFRDEQDRWQAEIDGKLCDPHADPALAENVARIWHGGLRIDEQSYEWVKAIKEHARAHDPAHPSLNPAKAVNYNTLQPLVRARTAR